MTNQNLQFLQYQEYSESNSRQFDESTNFFLVINYTFRHGFEIQCLKNGVITNFLLYNCILQKLVNRIVVVKTKKIIQSLVSLKITR